MIWYNILVGVVLMLVTIFVHSLVTKYIIHFARKEGNAKIKHRNLSDELWVAFSITIMFLAALAESSLWALVYFLIGAVPTFETALYFSIVTFTTLGYGDVILNDYWRLLASFEAAIGIMIFGWSTAVVVAIVQKLYFRKS